MSSEATGCSAVPRDFLPYHLDYIPEFLRKRAKSELFEDEDTRVHSLKLLRSMLKDEKDLHWQDDDLFLLAFLRARKFDVKRAFQLVKTSYNVLGKHDELYYNFNYDLVKKTIQDNAVGILPYRDMEGCPVLLIRVSHWKPQVNTMGDYMRYLSCSLLHGILSPATQVTGFKAIVDISGLTFKHLPHVSPSYLWLFAEALQNCFPARFKAIHIVNEDHIFTYVWLIIKQFLTKKIKERFHFHGKNPKKLHKYFSPAILPAEYGGELPPYDNTEFGNMLEEHADYFAHVFSHGYEKHKAKSQEKYANRR